MIAVRYTYTAPGVSAGNPDLAGWNAQKLATSFGHRPVANMQELLNANDAFNNTFTKVAQNAETARRRAMVKALEDADWKPKDLVDTHYDNATVLGLVIRVVPRDRQPILPRPSPARNRPAFQTSTIMTDDPFKTDRAQTFFALLEAGEPSKSHSDARDMISAALAHLSGSLGLAGVAAMLRADADRMESFIAAYHPARPCGAVLH